MFQIISGNIRVQFLSEDIIRVEYGKKGKFCDKDTFFIPNRNSFAGCEKFTQSEEAILFGEYSLYIPENARTLSGVKLKKGGKTVYAYKKKANSGELPLPGFTPEVFALTDSPRILVPNGGYTYRGDWKNSAYEFEGEVQDVYLLLCAGDAKKLRKLYVALTGQSELVRLSVLGGWNSKYYVYDEESAKQLILDYERHQVPLDMMVLDTDWRAPSPKGVGYDVNTKLFPNMKRFLNFAHEHGVGIMFNDHPEPVEGAENILSPDEVKFREECLQALLNIGLDIWWYDRNWPISLKSPIDQVEKETWGMACFSDITRNFYKRKAKNQEIYRRPVIMGNVNDVLNGEYNGVKDSASHRYSIQWTGDIMGDTESLAREVENIIRCSANAIPYVNSDCGGNIGDPNKELFIRWMQYGALSPVFRPHCMKLVERTREPWVFDEETLNIVREYNNLRYRLLPVLYRGARQSWETGEPICKALAFEYPNDKRAAARLDEYMIGNDILVAPVTMGNAKPVEQENYVGAVHTEYYKGTKFSGDKICCRNEERIRIVPNDVPKEASEGISVRFSAKVRFEKPMRLYLCYNDCAKVIIDGEKVRDDTMSHRIVSYPLCDAEAGRDYSVTVEYYSSGSDLTCELCAKEIGKDRAKSVYLPRGKWLDVFSGKIYTGGKTIQKRCGLREMPLFVRTGALIPLAQEAQNTKQQKWDRLAFDFYPDKDSCDAGYLYEDDGETTAYQQGEYRKSEYKAWFDRDKNCFTIAFGKGIGNFYGERAFTQRKIALRYHLLAGSADVEKVTVNGKEMKYSVERRNGNAFPLSFEGGSPDSKLLQIDVTHKAEEELRIELFLKKSPKFNKQDLG